MIYNVYFRTSTQDHNIFGLNEDRIQKLIKSYREGNSTITFAGTQYHIAGLLSIKIFSYEGDEPLEKSLSFYRQNIFSRSKRIGGPGIILPPSTLRKMGREVTSELISDAVYGGDKKATTFVYTKSPFIALERINQLKEILPKEHDFTKLIRLCEELNINYEQGNYLSVAMAARAIIDHVPPLFGFKTFTEVANNYGERSFKKNMQHLDQSMRSVADSFLHQTIRKKESLPTENGIDFKQNFDMLLGEIVRISTH